MSDAPKHPSPGPPPLGPWHRRVVPKLLDCALDTEETRSIRARVCAELEGEVLEIGFGGGLNLAHLPPSVSRVLAVDPLERSWQFAHERIEAADVEVEHVGYDARSLSLPDHSVDAVLCTWSLCSIPEPERAVAEAARVLRPGGRLHFVEHGRSDVPGVHRWQRRLDPLWSRVVGGCHLHRDIPEIVTAGGLRIDELTTYTTESEPQFLGSTFEGTAEPALVAVG